MTTEITSRAPRVVRGWEFEQVLRAAEDVLAQASASRRLLALTDAALAGAVALILVAAGIAVATTGFALAAAPSMGALVLSFLVARTAAIRLRTRLRAGLYQDETYAAETAGMLRELQPIVEEREQWSGLRSETVSRRIARFPIKASHR